MFWFISNARGIRDLLLLLVSSLSMWYSCSKQFLLVIFYIENKKIKNKHNFASPPFISTLFSDISDVCRRLGYGPDFILEKLSAKSKEEEFEAKNVAKKLE